MYSLKIRGIIWLEQVVEKIARKHGVQAYEVEEVLGNSPRIQLIEKGKIIDENLYVAKGQSYGGRYLAVFFIYKRTKEALIITARDMDRSERKSYEKDGKRR